MGTQTLGGTGDVEFADHVYTGTFMDLTGANSVLTVAAGVTLEALPGSGSTTALGTISADESGSSIVFDGTVGRRGQRLDDRHQRPAPTVS